MGSINGHLNWLHISDAHLKCNAPYDRDRVLNAFLASLPDLMKRYGQPDLIFFTGDLANTGKASEYNEATAFFDKLLAITSLTKDRLFVIPGNHDVDRSKGKGLQRTLHSSEAADEVFDPANSLLHITERQRDYSDWYKSYFGNLNTFSHTSSVSGPHKIAVRGQRVEVLSVNTSIFSFDDADHNKLWVGARCLEIAKAALDSQPSDLVIALLHHPLDWLSQSEQANAKASLRTSADVILGGHLHSTDAEKIAGLHGTAVHLTAGSLYEHFSRPKKAMFVTVSGQTLTIHPIRYEDSPAPVWTTDPSVYPNSTDHSGTIEIRKSILHDLPSVSAVSIVDPRDGLGSEIAVESAANDDFRGDLFIAGETNVLYVEPRLYWDQQQAEYSENAGARVSIDDVIIAADSFIIESRVEYGGTSLCKRLALEFAKRKTLHVYRKDARLLPNYRKKLETEFSERARTSGSIVLILDNFDVEAHDKLLKEINASKWFSRIIAVSTNRGSKPSALIDQSLLGLPFKFLYLWSIDRSDVRLLAAKLFDSSDNGFVSAVVDKVYRDLLDLRIPLTPANVIMYLKILFREGDFQPLNRVDIVGRYLSEMLTRPSDAYRDSFNVKNKVDVLSSFAHELYLAKNSEFSDQEWHAFSKKYQDRTLTEFNSTEFLEELISARVLLRYGSIIYFKYSFFFSYFVGKYIAARPDRLKEFLSTDEYMSILGVVEVVTGLNSDNTAVVEHITARHDSLLNEFSEKYLAPSFEPLGHAVWPVDEKNDEPLWQAVHQELEGPAKTNSEIDLVKSSILAEARTADQQVHYYNFRALEVSLFFVSSILSDALKNGDDIDGALKLRAMTSIFRGHQVAFQIGAMFSSAIAKTNFFRWGGLGFIDFAQDIDTEGRTPHQISAQIVVRINDTVAITAAEQMGTKKLGPVFKAREKNRTDTGYLEFLNFYCLLLSRPPGWETCVQEALERTDRKSYYLYAMLNGLLREYNYGVVQSKDKEKIKRLIAVVQAKRNVKKEAPSTGAVDRILKDMEKDKYFESITTDKSDNSEKKID